MGDNRSVKVPPEIADPEPAAITDPAALLEHAWALEPWGRYGERAAVLDALAQLLEHGVPPAPPGRDWQLELAAERSIDDGRQFRLDPAISQAERVLGAAPPTARIALGRAQLSLGQALAWVGTDDATRRAHQAFADAARIFAALGRRDWQGSALLRRGYSACYQYGDLIGAEELIREALATYEPGSERLPGALASYADVLIDLGRLDEADAALDRAAAIAEDDGFEKARVDIHWARARVAAGRGDARTTERVLLEAERESGGMDWFDTHIGLSYLLEAAELLDRVGLHDQARRYLERGRKRAGDADEEVMQAAAVLEARTGDPELALEQLQRLVRGVWLEKRVVWRQTLLTAWATFRAGRSGAGGLAARALQQAAACGGIQVAAAGEPVITAALAPIAERAGSAEARELMLAGRQLLVRLFGAPAVFTADGTALGLPAGMPGKLVRLLALHEHGLPVELVLETFFPEASPAAGRQRLRQVLKRLRAAAGDVVLRDEDTLRLVPAWVDAREFLIAANAVRGLQAPRAVVLAYGALALHSGPLLPSDPYDAWAEDTRQQVSYRHLWLLDLVATDAARRGSHQEAVTALEAALEQDPNDAERRVALSDELQALGRHRAATFQAANARATA